MVLRSKAKKDLVSECKGREILPHETPKKSDINNTIIIPTPHVDLTSGVSTEVGSAAINAVVPKPVICVVPKTVTCVPQQKQEKIKKKTRSKEVENPFKEPPTSTSSIISKN